MFNMFNSVLEWRPMSEAPSDDGDDYLLLNPCDGYHVVVACDGDFYPFTSDNPYHKDYFLCWAKLPALDSSAWPKTVA